MLITPNNLLFQLLGEGISKDCIILPLISLLLFILYKSCLLFSDFSDFLLSSGKLMATTVCCFFLFLFLFCFLRVGMQ